MELTVEVMDKIASNWYLKVNGTDVVNGFRSRLEALDYYRTNVLPTKPNSVALYAYVGIGDVFAYQII